MVDAQGGEIESVITFLQLLGEPEAGIGTIYSALDDLAQRYSLTDAVLTIDDRDLGLQVFRLGRRSVEPGQGMEAIERGRGLHTVPDQVPPYASDALVGLAQLAVALHVNRHRAGLDPLTGVNNLRSFEEALANAAANSARYGWTSTIMVLDLQHLDPGRSPTDEGGVPMVGDDALARCGQALGEVVRTGDVAGRLGHSRFGVILANAPAEAVSAFLKRLMGEIGESLANVRIATGAASSPADSVDPAELLRLAAERLG